jgi:hypothetical protein
MEWKIEEPVMEVVRFDVPSFEDRKAIISALTNSGYYVRVVEEKESYEISSKYFVEVILPKETEDGKSL